MAGRFFKASIEYEYVIFKTIDNITRTEALLKKTECLKQLKQFPKAASNLTRVKFTELNDSLKLQVYYESALCYYLSGNYNQSESNLLQIRHFIKDNSLSQKSLLIYTLVLNEQYQWETAQNIFLEWGDLAIKKGIVLKENIDEIDSLYSTKITGLKSTKRAKRLSAIFPGLGHFYCGKPAEGIISLGLVSSTVILSVYTFNSAFFIPTFGLGPGIFQQVYFGGIKRAEKLATQKNYQIKNEYNKNIKNSILKFII